ncbi:DUF2971 domain-containing protein [Edwardsiella anguillarum]|uniref:DUF2971 domain-containing protein n=1 Tax=Edwardsiella anguillarum TaxID=1821960 RepID=UPI0024B8634D|nr:DUF2971 domain-containing protein [Edwardsiella anguillarum]WHP80378.1 DUF2971 domain-containing protein [Edwardsiella anguillarum]WHQ17877.1 DUF2971 domain-containing protein [Edwardsiella anguillarum]WHQ21415.1 DUF2971 domain-containing protein [Edwardsiella anguillarum]WHQ24938.1 DUF2971 domain-containing protein [Edwardsiella anguillarum]WHQ28463.1 DUF2971 domain-containing protein [Edwardsiella anguillarum]
MKAIYHYTGQAGLLGIIEGKSIRCTNHKFLNDRMEYNYAVDTLKSHCEYIREKLTENTQSGLEEAEALSNFFKATSDFVVKNIRDTYVACFTTKPDDTNHWQAYGNKQVSYAIEFDLGELEKAINMSGRAENSSKLIEYLGNPKENDEGIPGGYLLQHFKPRIMPVSYDPSQIINIIDYSGFSELTKSTNKSSPAETLEKIEKFTLGMINKALFAFPTTKKKEWSHESEYRIVLSESRSVNPETKLREYIKGKEKLIKWYDAGAYPVPFVEFPINPKIIKKVTFLAAGHNERIIEALELLKGLHGLNFNIEASKSCYYKN